MPAAISYQPCRRWHRPRSAIGLIQGQEPMPHRRHRWLQFPTTLSHAARAKVRHRPHPGPQSNASSQDALATISQPQSAIGLRHRPHQPHYAIGLGTRRVGRGAPLPSSRATIQWLAVVRCPSSLAAIQYGRAGRHLLAAVCHCHCCKPRYTVGYTCRGPLPVLS